MSVFPMARNLTKDARQLDCFVHLTPPPCGHPLKRGKREAAEFLNLKS